ncbi:MAG: hypothetical protein IJY61_01070 [Candidatus Gastranaerophilales bacterium]|nr:hypothetical protein [Candidatus Gastranaerophilales bacterium]
MDAWDIFNVVIKVVQAAFQVKKAVEVRKEAKYQTDILRQEAKQAKEDAADERQQGLDEARRIRLKSILNMSEMKSDIASNNILLSSKTALNLVTDEKLNGELDALVTLQNSERTAENYLRQSQKYYQNAALKSASSKNNLVNSVSNSVLNLSSNILKIAQK